jgi:hypothetical protein
MQGMLRRGCSQASAPVRGPILFAAVCSLHVWCGKWQHYLVCIIGISTGAWTHSFCCCVIFACVVWEVAALSGVHNRHQQRCVGLFFAAV